MYDKSQLYKGLLEGCILQIISQESSYGYDIVLKLNSYGFSDVKEGTIYPLLVRLEKKEIIKGTQRPSPLGPKRKYYDITKAGLLYLDGFMSAWREVELSVNSVLGDDLHV